MHVHVVAGKLMKHEHELLLGADFLDSVQVPEDDEIREICQLDVVTDEVNSIDVTHIPNTEHRNAIKGLVEYKPQKTRETKLKMSILLKDDEPVYQRARRLSPIEREQVNTQVDE
jgi:hypothetical protein